MPGYPGYCSFAVSHGTEAVFPKRRGRERTGVSLSSVSAFFSLYEQSICAKFENDIRIIAMLCSREDTALTAHCNVLRDVDMSLVIFFFSLFSTPPISFT